MPETTNPQADGLFVPPAADGLPLAALDSATEGADRLDAMALTPYGRNLLAHALVQLARDGWLRTEPGAGFEPVRDRETPDPQPTSAPGRVAGEAPQPEAQAEAHPPTVTWEIESPRRGTWASWGATYDEHDWARERFQDAIGHVPARQFRLVRATTVYTVEAEQPAVVSQPDGEA